MPPDAHRGDDGQERLGDVRDGTSLSRKNSKSSAMKASGGCEGQEMMRL